MMKHEQDDQVGDDAHGGRGDLGPAARPQLSHDGLGHHSCSRVDDLMDQFDIGDMDELKHALEDYRQWSKELPTLSADLAALRQEQERLNDELADFRDVAERLHEFQLRYETATWQPGCMPGNELYSKQLMMIVGAARRTLKIGSGTEASKAKRADSPRRSEAK